ncbi:hypothetical protein ASZ78_013259 [Callipepla squamata]|uniref:Protein kinase domain-containing protein n=1 Tax=Callipepla squamata TaxID=9009 RepID=A0A226N3Q9_CALSU|nr:hypothetical protein ASZ78_013259 [Callipepla squamata]
MSRPAPPPPRRAAALLLPAARCRSAPAKRLPPLHDGPAEEAPAAKCPRLAECPGGTPDCLSAPGSPCAPASPAAGGGTLGNVGAAGPSLIASYLLLPLAEREQVSRALSVSSGRELRCKVSAGSPGAARRGLGTVCGFPLVRCALRGGAVGGGSRCRSSIPGIVCQESLDAVPLPTPSRTNAVLVSSAQVFPLKHYQDKIRPYVQLPSHRNITGVVEVILGDTKAYVFFEKDFGDMHSYVRSCKRLREEEAARLFRQIVAAVAHCHQSAIVLGDLKLRKFVFSNEERTQLRLESLEDTHIIKGEDDALSDKHGCPAYVSPEILNTTGTYSGKSADVWSLGVMLYTLLVGRYPFHDSDPSTLFSKIRRGQFCIPDHVSPKARCLIRSLLRREPSERLTAPEILLHPWFEAVLEPGYTDQETGTSDQIVPEYHGDNDDISSFFC